jgi:hypothetical protein
MSAPNPSSALLRLSARAHKSLQRCILIWPLWLLHLWLWFDLIGKHWPDNRKIRVANKVRCWGNIRYWGNKEAVVAEILKPGSRADAVPDFALTSEEVQAINALDIGKRRGPDPEQVNAQVFPITIQD